MNSDEFTYHEDYYTIKEGKVYMIQKDGTLYPSGDSCFDTVHEGVMLGKYKEGMKKNVPLRTFTRKQFLKIMNRRTLKSTSN